MREGKTVPPLSKWRRAIVKAKADAWLAMDWIRQQETHGHDAVCMALMTKLTYSLDALAGLLEEAHEHDAQLS